MLTKENLPLLPALGTRGPITSLQGLLWQKSPVVCRESSSALTRSVQPQEPPSCTALRSACFVSRSPCSQPSSFVLPAHLRHRITTAAASRMLAHSPKEEAGVGPLPPPQVLTMETPTPLQCCIFKSPPSRDALPVHQTSPAPHCCQGPRGLDGKSPAEMTPRLPPSAAPTPSPRQKRP